MKRVLVLGAGLVSRPIVRHLLDRAFAVVVADQDESRAEALVAGAAHGGAIRLDASDHAALARLVDGADLVVSLLPYTLHPVVARACLDLERDLVTTSYVSPAMRALDAEARSKGVMLLNECGLDPGLDHMSARRVLSRLEAEGAVLDSFWSSTGGLPAPEAATNPWRYKFSWSPRGVLLAGRNAARYRRDGEIVEVPGERLFDATESCSIPGLGELEVYPNRDSLPYAETYGIEGARGMFRGTIRYRGWSSILRQVGALGLLDLEERDLAPGTTWADFVAGKGQGSARERAAARIGAGPEHPALDALEWAGCLSERPVGATRISPLDALCALLQERLAYAPGERDMIVMEHRFRAGERSLVSRLVAYGEPFGDSAMARTVSLPAAIAGRLRLEGSLEASGVLVPVLPEIYEPVLDEMASLGVAFEESEA